LERAGNLAWSWAEQFTTAIEEEAYPGGVSRWIEGVQRKNLGKAVVIAQGQSTWGSSQL
jgi:hypothetical protein